MRDSRRWYLETSRVIWLELREAYSANLWSSLQVAKERAHAGIFGYRRIIAVPSCGHFNVMFSIDLGTVTGFPIEVKGECEACGGNR